MKNTSSLAATSGKVMEPGDGGMGFTAIPPPSVMCGNVRAVKHGLSYTTEYQSWYHMWRRCTDQSSPVWKNYGGRGITVCDRWRDCSKFYADMGRRPIGGTLDRIDNDGNYEPGNCRWATRHEQRINQRPKRKPVAAHPWRRGYAVPTETKLSKWQKRDLSIKEERTL